MSRGWKLALGAALLLSLLAEVALPEHGGEHLWELDTFFAWFGLLGCVAIIVLSKALGKHLLQRPEGYYGEGGAAGEREGRDGG